MADLKITGTVKEILEEQSGEGKNGPWRKQDFVLETEGQYPRPVCITQWGENIEKFGVQEGETLTAHIDIQSREYNGRWYTDVKAWRVDREGPAGGAGGGGVGPGSGGAADPGPGSGGGGPAGDLSNPDDDLPF